VGGHFQVKMAGSARQMAGFFCAIFDAPEAAFQPQWAQRGCGWQNSALLKQLMESGKWHSTYTR
jgi:hypothetical protein